MTTPVLLFSLVGLGFFYLENLVFFPHVRLRLLDLLIFIVALRPSLGLAISLGLALGLLQDCYAATPFGVHLGSSLVLVATARFFRQRLLWQRLGTLILATLTALTLQEGFWQLIMVMLGTPGPALKDFLNYRSLEILGTLALAPLMYALVLGLEKAMGRFGWRPLREPAASGDF